MAKRRKVIRAGRVVRAVVYSVAHPSDGEQARAAKQKCTTMARQAINLRYAYQKLEMELAANFNFGDLHAVFTYDDDHLPSARDDAVKLLKKTIVQIRKAKRLVDDILKYVYVTEGAHGDKRLHHHMVLNGSMADLEMLRSLWPYGDVHLETIDERGYEGLARYLTKEAREHGGTRGLRSWTPSRNLKKPEVESGWVPDDVTLTTPPGAIVLDSPPPVRNEFGEFAYIKYLLPEPKTRKRKGRPSRRKPPKTA